MNQPAGTLWVASVRFVSSVLKPLVRRSGQSLALNETTTMNGSATTFSPLMERIAAAVAELCRPTRDDWERELKAWLYAELCGPFQPGHMLTCDDLNLLHARLRSVEGRLKPQNNFGAVTSVSNVKDSFADDEVPLRG
jgi:hypothetical protein